MKLISGLSRRYKDKEYYKFFVILPAKVIEKLGWKKGQDLSPKVKGKRLIIKGKNGKKNKNRS